MVPKAKVRLGGRSLSTVSMSLPESLSFPSSGVDCRGPKRTKRQVIAVRKEVAVSNNQSFGHRSHQIVVNKLAKVVRRTSSLPYPR